MPFPTYTISPCNMKTLNDDVVGLGIAGFLGINATGDQYTAVFSSTPSSEDQTRIDDVVSAHDSSHVTRAWELVTSEQIIGVDGVDVTIVKPAWQDLGGLVFNPTSPDLNITRVRAHMAASVTEGEVGGGVELRIAELTDADVTDSLMAGGVVDVLDNGGNWRTEIFNADDAPVGGAAQFILQGRLKNATDAAAVRCASLHMKRPKP